jgi:hypothetical protein
VENPVHLVASHCKPWRDATNEERLDGENGLLLTPSIDHLFDRGFIGFEDNGRLIISPVAHHPSLQRMGSIRPRPSMLARSQAVKSSFSISIETMCCLNLFDLSESVLQRRRPKRKSSMTKDGRTAAARIVESGRLVASARL